MRIENFSAEIFSSPISLGIILGLFFGKQIGVMLASLVAIKLRLASLPRGATWLEFYGVTILTGIGFTMSFFIGVLAFGDNQLLFDQAKIGVLFGSLLSMLLGVAVICFAKK